MAEEEVAVATATASPAPLDLKRKLEDLEAEEAPAEQTEPSESNGGDFDSAASDEASAKRPRLDGEPDASASENGHQEENAEEPVKESDDQPQLEEVSGKVTDEQPLEATQEPSVQNTESTEEQENQPQPLAEDHKGDDHSTQQEQPPSDDGTITRRMEIPNNKVGVLIGKSGETIRYLQYNSGAKIQITKDVDTDPQSTTRPVEMVGTLESVKKAEKLINAVIAEAEAGGSPSLVARGHGASQAASEQIEMQVPNEKVGVIIGKGGETIKGLQTRSGARIQLIPQHLPDGDESKERTVRVTGDKRQIELAREMIKDVMNQPSRPSHSGGFNQQQGYRPRGPPQWGGGGGGPRGHHMGGHQNSYDYQQRGQYSSHNQQYPPPYRGYPQQMGPRGGGWEQRPPPPSMNQHGGGYDYYGGHKGHLPEPGQHSGPPPSMNQPPHSQGNYNYGQNQNQNQNQGPDYGHHHPPPHQQQQGYGYDDHHHRYGGSQPYQHTGYGPPPPQQYPKPPYGGAPPPPQYQTPPPPQQQQQQPYPYAPAGPTQQAYPSYPEGYGQAPAPAPLQPASGYPQQGVQPQAGPAAAIYGQYPSQQGYSDPNSAGYGYQDPAAYGAAPAPAGQTVYAAQATTAAAQGQQGYDQTGSGQQAYGVAQPSAASAGYGAKTVSPQPQPQTAYAQYDSAQMYAAPH